MLEVSGLTVEYASSGNPVRAVDDVAPTLADLAAALHLPDRSPPGADRLLDPPPAARSGRPRAWVPIWRRPWMTINGATYGSSILAAAGIVNVYEDAEASYPTITLEAAADRHPDVVLAPSEPYPFAPRHRAQLEAVAPTPGLIA